MNLNELKYLLRAFDRALDAGVSAAIFIAPRSGAAQFFCDDNITEPHSGKHFFVVPWRKTFDSAFVIRQCLSPEQALQRAPQNNVSSFKPWEISTDKTEYLATVEKIASTLAEGQKVVLSTVLSERIDKKDTQNIALHFLSHAPENTFRAIMYTPQTGCWIVASPELLLSFEKTTRIFSTMSLAGTRPYGENDPWDKKNIDEQQIVSHYICNKLESVADNVCGGQPETLNAGKVSHILTRITAKARLNVSAADILDILSPTPAVCGEPSRSAIKAIETFEKHPRHLYGGYFGIDDGSSLTASVMLRCLHVGDHNCTIYAGGGITHCSIAANEWQETRMKATDAHLAVEASKTAYQDN